MGHEQEVLRELQCTVSFVLDVYVCLVISTCALHPISELAKRR